MTDTSPEIASLVHARLMAKTGAECVRMHEAARRRVMASFRQRLTQVQQRELLRRRFYGQDSGHKKLMENKKGFVEMRAEVYQPA